jgi:hypothetical protein
MTTPPTAHAVVTAIKSFEWGKVFVCVVFVLCCVVFLRMKRERKEKEGIAA